MAGDLYIPLLWDRWHRVTPSTNHRGSSAVQLASAPSPCVTLLLRYRAQLQPRKTDTSVHIQCIPRWQFCYFKEFFLSNFFFYYPFSADICQRKVLVHIKLLRFYAYCCRNLLALHYIGVNEIRAHELTFSPFLTQQVARKEEMLQIYFTTCYNS